MFSERRRWGPLALAGGLILALAPASPAASQQTEAPQSATEEALIQRLDSLAPLVEAAEREAAEIRRLREEAARDAAAVAVDTFQVGLLTVLALPKQRELAEEIYGQVWAEDYAGRVQQSPSLEDHVFTFQWQAELEPIHVTGPHRRVESRPYRTRAMLEEMIRQGVGTVLELDLRGMHGTGPAVALADWRRGPIMQPTRELGTNVYRQLAVSPSHENEACLKGDPGACWTALGLGVASGRVESGEDLRDREKALLEAWYTPQERRAFVENRYRTYSMRFRERLREDETYVGCVQQGLIDVCDDYLLEWRYRLPLPLDRNQARNAMTWLAVQAGSDGAWSRLLEDPEMTPEEALLYASGQTPDELARSWRDWVMQHQPTHAAALGGFGWGHLVTLFWIVVFAALAMRSTRWRLG